MSTISGDLRILHIKRLGGDWQQVAHLTSNSWENTTEFLPTTTRDNYGHQTDVPLKNSGSISFNAIIFEDSDIASVKIGYKTLKDILTNQEIFEWKLEALNKNFTDYGQGHLESISETAESGTYMTYSGTIKVYGKTLDVADIEPPTTPYLNFLEIDPLIPNIGLTWEVSTDNLAVAGYEIRRTVNSKSTIIDVGNVTEWTDNGVQYFIYHSYNVRAYDITGNYSGWSNKRAASVPVPPAQPTPDYMLYEDGETILDEQGIPLIYE